MRLQLQSGGKNMDSDISTMEAAEAAIRTMRYSNIKRNLEFDFYIGKKIWNKDVYDMLVEKRMECGLIEDVSYFPLYRAKIKE